MIPIATILAHNHHPTFQVYVAQNLFYPANLRERGVVVKKICVFSAIWERYSWKIYISHIWHWLKLIETEEKYDSLTYILQYREKFWMEFINILAKLVLVLIGSTFVSVGVITIYHAKLSLCHWGKLRLPYLSTFVSLGVVTWCHAELSLCHKHSCSNDPRSMPVMMVAQDMLEHQLWIARGPSGLRCFSM